MVATVTQVWNHTEPPARMQEQDLQLLTICGVSVLGRWSGELGDYFVGWACYARVEQLPPPVPYKLQAHHEPSLHH